MCGVGRECCAVHAVRIPDVHRAAISSMCPHPHQQRQHSLRRCSCSCQHPCGFHEFHAIMPSCNLSLLICLLCAGEKLSESRASDVRELCNTLLSAYLIQLLDTGLLHADPHPGNLIRTNDGKICVLDFGLMTEVTPEQRIALVEYIAHLSIKVRPGWLGQGAEQLQCLVCCCWVAWQCCAGSTVACVHSRHPPVLLTGVTVIVPCSCQRRSQ